MGVEVRVVGVRGLRKVLGTLSFLLFALDFFLENDQTNHKDDKPRRDEKLFSLGLLFPC